MRAYDPRHLLPLDLHIVRRDRTPRESMTPHTGSARSGGPGGAQTARPSTVAGPPARLPVPPRDVLARSMPVALRGGGRAVLSATMPTSVDA